MRINRNVTLRNHMNEQVLYHLYVRKGWYPREIAEEFDVERTAVRHQLDRFGMEREE